MEGLLLIVVAVTDLGAASVPQPGLRVRAGRPGSWQELNEAVVKEHLRRPGIFGPSTKWDDSFVGRGSGGPWPHFNVDGVWVNERTTDY
jgi:hypothetical protein